MVHIASGKDLESEFAKMIPHFEGKETEHNWGAREASIVRARGMLRGGVYARYPEWFISGLKAGFFEGVCKTVGADL